MAPAGCFLRGLLPRDRFGKRRNLRRTRCNPSCGRGFCRFVRLRAVPRGCLLRRRMGRTCAAICVARRRPLGGRFRARGLGRRVAAHDVLEVVLAGHEVLLGRDLRRVSEPRGDDVDRVLLHPVGLAGGPEVLQDPRPGHLPGLGNDPLEVRAKVHGRPGGRRHHDGGSSGCVFAVGRREWRTGAASRTGGVRLPVKTRRGAGP